MACCIEIAVQTIFKTHTYSFGGETYLQHDGGPIGLRVTGAVAKIVMAYWARMLSDTLADNNIDVWFKAGYVDDIRLGIDTLKLGSRWDLKTKKIIYSQETEENDKQNGTT